MVTGLYVIQRKLNYDNFNNKKKKGYKMLNKFKFTCVDVKNYDQTIYEAEFFKNKCIVSWNDIDGSPLSVSYRRSEVEFNISKGFWAIQNPKIVKL